MPTEYMVTCPTASRLPSLSISASAMTSASLGARRKLMLRLVVSASATGDAHQRWTRNGPTRAYVTVRDGNSHSQEAVAQLLDLDWHPSLREELLHEVLDFIGGHFGH
jgi:hypothetical protein